MDKVVFPSPEWVFALKEKLNTDEQYARIAHNWEGDMRIVVEPDQTLKQTMWFYFDLWHGKCPDAYLEDPSSSKVPTLVINGTYANMIKILSGEVGVLQGLMTRMLTVKGSMAKLMRNVPTVLDFVRCCQEVTSSWL